eukprot:gene12417-12553_t
MLRRLKEAVATELPQKHEVVLRCPLGAYQSALYDMVRRNLRAETGAGSNNCSEGNSQRRCSSTNSCNVSVKGVNNTMMELRNICNHPLLSKLHPEYGEDLVKDPSPPVSSDGAPAATEPTPPAVLRLSSKVDLLDQVLVRLAAGGHKVLLFCTMTRMLDLLEEYMAWRGWTYLRLDGATSGAERADAVAQFNRPGTDVFIFMLSLRAGGVGLNLQAADTVIMYDSDWNPQIDLQAQARAHRIGQLRDVLVVRLVAQHTIEEHILQVAEEKRKFADSSITGGFFDGQTTHQQRRRYLLSILDTAQCPDSDNSVLHALTAAQLNSLIARGPREQQMLQDRDMELANHHQQQDEAGGLGYSGGTGQQPARLLPEVPAPASLSTCQQASLDRPLSRIATAEQCADLIAAALEAAAPKPAADIMQYGRGVKRTATATAVGVPQLINRSATGLVTRGTGTATQHAAVAAASKFNALAAGRLSGLPRRRSAKRSMPDPPGAAVVVAADTNTQAEPVKESDDLVTLEKQHADGTQEQCFTTAGYGRKTGKGANGKVLLTAFICPIGTYNLGGNQQGCTKCPLDARAGWYINTDGARRVGTKCTIGTYTTGYNQNSTCTICSTGTTTLAEGSTLLSDCGYALPGYYMTGPTTAALCPLHTYNNQTAVNVTECTRCMNGYLTRDIGTTGPAQCLAPPGFELKLNATNITKCELHYYKTGWNRNPCLPCGPNLITLFEGADDFPGKCLVPVGYGIKSMFPPAAVLCVNSTYGQNELQEASLDARCSPCSPNMATTDILTGVVAAVGYTSDEDCLLFPGYGMSQNTVGGDKCEIAYYNPGLNRETCEPCPTRQVTLYEGAKQLSECVVMPGWQGDPATNLTKPCDKGYYSIGGNLTDPGGLCVACPAGYTTQEQESVSLAECTACTPGYGSAPGGSTCVICPYNTYATGGHAIGTECDDCPDGTVSGRLSMTQDQCLQAIIEPNQNAYSLSNSSLWVDISGTGPTREACVAACQADATCIVMKHADGLGDVPRTCQKYSPPATFATDAATQQLGVRVNGGADWAMYTVPADVTVGMLHEDAGDLTLGECMEACGDVARCEIFSFPSLNATATGSCKLWSSELDAEYSGVLHVTGSQLYQNLLLIAEGIV